MISYLAAPYSHAISRTRFYRYRQICYVTAELARRGEIIYSPISSWHFIAVNYNLPTDAAFWLPYMLEFLARCDKMYVLQLEGWENSVGVQREIEFATEHNIPIEYITMGEFGGKNNQHQ
jgi:hypothetical protein